MSEQSGRYQRSFGGFAGSMIVLVVLILVWLGFRALTSSTPDSPVQTVDYHQEVPAARRAVDFHLLAPPRLPDGWRATSVHVTAGPVQQWHLGVLTDAGRYVGLEQADRSVRSMLASYVDKAPERGAPVDVLGRRWSTWTDSGGDLALTAHQGRTTTLVVGHDVPRSDLISYASTLR